MAHFQEWTFFRVRHYKLPQMMFFSLFLSFRCAGIMPAVKLCALAADASAIFIASLMLNFSFIALLLLANSLLIANLLTHLLYNFFKFAQDFYHCERI